MMDIKKVTLLRKTSHYPNTIKSHLVTTVSMTFTLKSTSKLSSDLHFRYSIAISRLTSQSYNHYNHGFYNTFDCNHYMYSVYLLYTVTASVHIIR